MYIVTIRNGTTATEIQNERRKLLNGTVVQGINTIDSFTLSVLPGNPAFGELNDFTTLVNVYNTARQRYEFFGRVLCTSPQMSADGLITQEATCENYFGFLCDSRQDFVAAQNWTPEALLERLITCHNSRLESYKHFLVGTVDVPDEGGKLNGTSIPREKTWDAIKKCLLDVIGGEICLRVEIEDGVEVNYIDYKKQLGHEVDTPIALSKNMKSIVKEKDPSAFITRLIPLGAKVGDNTEERYGIASANDGKEYIDDEEAIAEYGLHVGHVEFDEEIDPAIIKSLGEAWLKENNKVSVKYSVTALDLSLIGLDAHDFQVCNTHPLQNKLLGIDVKARISKKSIDVCEETKTSFEIGESFKTLSELQKEQSTSIGNVEATVAEIIRNYATNERLTNEIASTVSLINQTQTEIMAGVSASYATKDEVKNVSAELSLKVNTKDLISEINAAADVINITSNRLTIDSDYFKLTADGTITATAGYIGSFAIEDNGLTYHITAYEDLNDIDADMENITMSMTPGGFLYVRDSYESLGGGGYSRFKQERTRILPGHIVLTYKNSMAANTSMPAIMTVHTDDVIYTVYIVKDSEGNPRFLIQSDDTPLYPEY